MQLLPGSFVVMVQYKACSFMQRIASELAEYAVSLHNPLFALGTRVSSSVRLRDF